jgi:nicotinamide-nucleotide amidase
LNELGGSILLEEANRIDRSTSSKPALSPSKGQALSTEFAAALRARGWSCATAESCTGGLVGHIITSLAGSSDYFKGGVIAYSNQAKLDLLDVKESTLEARGAVSAETAGEMARGARVALAADVGIATTGIAGPGGATERKPVGLVYIAVSTPERESVRELRLNGDRIENIEQSAAAALRLAIEQLAPTR